MIQGFAQEQSSNKKQLPVNDKGSYNKWKRIFYYCKYRKDYTYDSKISQILVQWKQQQPQLFSEVCRRSLQLNCFHCFLFEREQEKTPSTQKQEISKSDKNNLDKASSEQQKLVIKYQDENQKAMLNKEEANTEKGKFELSLNAIREGKIDRKRNMTVVEKIEKEVEIERDKQICFTTWELQLKIKAGIALLLKKDNLGQRKLTKKQEIIEIQKLTIQNILAKKQYILLGKCICSLMNNKYKSLIIGHLQIDTRKLVQIPRQIITIRNKFISPKASKHPDLLIKQLRDTNNKINIEITINYQHFNKNCQYNLQWEPNDVWKSITFYHPYQQESEKSN